MSKEEEFKKQLRDLVESKSFPFEESDWHSAKKVIDAQRRKKYRLPFILFMAGLGVIGLMLWPDSDKPTVALNSLQNQNPSVSPASEKLKSQIAGTPKPVGSSNSAVTKTLENGRVPELENKEADLEKNPLAISQDISEKPQANADPLQDHLDKLPPSEKSSAELPLALALSADLARQNDSQAQPLQEKQLDTVTSDENSVEKNVSQDTMATIAQAIAASEAGTLQTIDSSAVAKEIAVVESPVFKKKMLISAEGGFNLLFGWKGIEKAEGRSVNPILGLNYHGLVSDKLECSAGFNLTTLMGLSSFSDTSKVTRYGFGEESEVTVISPRTLFYINFPLRLMWNFNLKQSAGFNLEPGYLVNASSHVETYVQSTSISGKESTKEFGYTQGLATFNMQFGLFYRQRLFDRVYLQPEVFIGLKDLKNNDFFNSNVTERSSGIKITLLYSLLHR